MIRFILFLLACAAAAAVVRSQPAVQIVASTNVLVTRLPLSTAPAYIVMPTTGDSFEVWSWDPSSTVNDENTLHTLSTGRWVRAIQTGRFKNIDIDGPLALSNVVADSLSASMITTPFSEVVTSDHQVVPALYVKYGDPAVGEVVEDLLAASVIPGRNRWGFVRTGAYAGLWVFCADLTIASNGTTIRRPDQFSSDTKPGRWVYAQEIYQPLDSDLTAIAALTTTSFGRSLLELANAAALRTTAGLVIGTDVQAWDADLDDLADGTLSGSKVGTGISAANVTTGTLPDARLSDAGTSVGTFGSATLIPVVTVDGKGRVTAVSTSAVSAGGVTDGDKGDLTVSGSGSTWMIDAGVVTLADLANLAQDQVIGRVSAGTGVPETFTVTAAARGVLDDPTVADMRTTLGLGNVENTALSTWAGSANITTLGTITSGTVPVARVSGLASVATSGSAADLSAGTIAGARLPNNGRRRVFYRVDGSGSAITAGASTIRYTEIPITGTITRAEIVADQTGSAVVDVWVDTYANYPPTVLDTITASAKPTLSSAIKNTDSTLTGWDTAVTAGEYMAFRVDSASTVTVLNVTIEITPP